MTYLTEYSTTIGEVLLTVIILGVVFVAFRTN